MRCKHESLSLGMRGDAPSFQFGKDSFWCFFLRGLKHEEKKKETGIIEKSKLCLIFKAVIFLFLYFFGLPTLATYFIFFFLFTPCGIFGLISVRNASLWRREAYLLREDG